MNEQQVCEVRRRRSRHEVEQLVAEFESSGLNRSEFCRERGLALSTLARHRGRREEQAPAGSNTLLSVEVLGRATGPVASAAGALTVGLCGGRRVEVGRGFDGGTLEQLVHVLEGL
jgi:hypothetical protein